MQILDLLFQNWPICSFAANDILDLLALRNKARHSLDGVIVAFDRMKLTDGADDADVFALCAAEKFLLCFFLVKIIDRSYAKRNYDNFFLDKRKISDLFLDGFGNGDGLVREEHGKPCDTDYQTFLKR